MFVCGYFSSDYFKQFTRLPINRLPTSFRMTHEQQKQNSEEHTKDNENMVHERGTPDINYTVAKVRQNPTTGGLCCHQGNGCGKSAYTLAGKEGGNGGLLDCFKLGEKRKLESFAPQCGISDLSFDSHNKKRLKAGESCLNVYGKNGFNRRINYGESFGNCNPSFQQNALSLNGISKDTTSTIDFTNNFRALSSFNLKKVRIATHDTRKLNSPKKPCLDFGDTSNLTNLGEPECIRHGASLSKHEKTCYEHPNNISNSSPEFISLDATKSSFLMQVIKMRQNAECNTPIICPFCSETFAKYPDLKSHVQTHKNSCIPGSEIKSDNSNQVQVLKSKAKDALLTPVSTHSPRSPSRPPSAREDALITRATSVIQFAEKKKENGSKKDE